MATEEKRMCRVVCDYAECSERTTWKNSEKSALLAAKTLGFVWKIIKSPVFVDDGHETITCICCKKHRNQIDSMLSRERRLRLAARKRGKSDSRGYYGEKGRLR